MPARFFFVHAACVAVSVSCVAYYTVHYCVSLEFRYGDRSIEPANAEYFSIALKISCALLSIFSVDDLI